MANQIISLFQSDVSTLQQSDCHLRIVIATLCFCIKVPKETVLKCGLIWAKWLTQIGVKTVHIMLITVNDVLFNVQLHFNVISHLSLFTECYGNFLNIDNQLASYNGESGIIYMTVSVQTASLRYSHQHISEDNKISYSW